MQIKFIYPRWGSSDLPWSVFLNKIKNAGYQGVEIDLPLESIKKNEICWMLKDLELDFVGQHWETQEADFNKHQEQYKRQLYNLVEANPLFVNSHTGMDFFTHKQNSSLIEAAHEIELESGVTITHETHRSRFSFAAHACLTYLEEYPFLKLTSDLSHWCCVAESLLENQAYAVEKAIEHTYHIHARVGSAQSPQVIDPQDSNYKTELDLFTNWWVLMIKKALGKKRPYITITPEYGPYPYSLYKSNTQIPMGDQWEINSFIKNHLAESIKHIPSVICP
ncbi:sugar phosphate isomerase/epimerase family protein [Arenibacter palladensis]|uniref:sugar phosphate isomerase/epimerase family protein n=1 Tax=Arenibacter palladensis TaxID=237373 RepID=UPI0026E41A19|nr:sugar phosphate isomerase/epimerase [Arenibacter palladensis]MDO6603923.1 sugar phosphate isomerase/epimerase [Arenibacter palladensis]